METHHETAGEGGGASFQYNFSFDDVDVGVDPFANSLPMPSEQMNNTAEHVLELGSSSGSPQPMNETHMSDPLHEQSQDLVPMGIAELNQPIQINQVQPSPPISDVPILPSPGITFSHELTRESSSPSQMDNLDFGPAAGNSWSIQNQGNSPQIFMAPTAAIPSYQSSNPSLIYDQNEMEATPSFFNSNMSRPTQPYRPIPMYMGVSVQDGVVQPYLPQKNVVIQPYPQMEQLPLSLTLGQSDYGPNTMMAGLGGINQRPPLINQQQATLYPQQLDLQSRVWTPQAFWPQHNQVMTANGVADPQWTNVIPYGTEHMRPLGTQQLMNQPQQLNYVQPPNTFVSQPHYPIQPAELSRPLGPQFSKNNQEINEVMTHNPWVLESSAITARVQNLPDGQDNQTWEVPHVLDSQHSNSNTPDPFMQSGPEGVGGKQQQHEQDQMIPNVVAHSQLPIPIRPRPTHMANPQHHSSEIFQSPMPFRFAPVQLQELLNPSTILSDSSSQRSRQLRNSPSEQQGTPQQECYYADKRRGKRPELGTSSSPAKQSKDQMQRNSAASTRTDVNRSIFQPEDKEVEICSDASLLSNPLRRMINTLYDPKFEELGLPIDPHIRLFQLQLQENAREKFPPMNR